MATLTPLVSICIPCFNAERYIGAALDSVLAQTYPEIEVVVVNDGSTDRSREILARYEDRVRVLDQPNKGQCAAANHAFAVSRGHLIKFFDADDVIAPDMISRQVERLAGRKNVVVLGEWTRFHGPAPAGEKFEPLPMYRDALPVDWLSSQWLDAQPMMQCGLWLLPRDVVDRAGLWDERLSLINDFEYFSRVLLAAREILYAPGARLYYRSGIPGSLSGQKSRKAVESQFLSLMLGTGHLLAAQDSPRVRRACANALISFDYEHYPRHADLRAQILARVAELGGANIAPSGPPGFHKLRRLIGWRVARHIQRTAERLNLNAAARRSRAGPTGA